MPNIETERALTRTRHHVRVMRSTTYYAHCLTCPWRGADYDDVAPARAEAATHSAESRRAGLERLATTGATTEIRVAAAAALDEGEPCFATPPSARA